MSFEITKAKRVSGGFFSLKDLAEAGPVLVLFRIVDFADPEPTTGYKGTNVPVIADAIVASGNRKGEVHLSEKFMGAITAVLRGVPNPRADKNIGVIPPENTIGQYVLARVKVLNPNSNNAAATGDEPSDVELAAVQGWFREDMWDVAAPEMATAGASSSAAAAAGDKPWLK